MTEAGVSGRSDGLVDAIELRADIHAALESAGVDAPTRPATTKLTHDQADLVVDLLDGFDDRRDLLEWAQDLVIQSLGQLEDSWYSRTLTNPAILTILLGRPYGPISEVDLEDLDALAAEIRRGIVAKDLLPAFHAAHRTFRWAAVERIDHLDDEGQGNDPEPIDPAAQAFPAMRPSLGELQGQQAAALTKLLDGFPTEERLLLWSLQLVGASYAEIDREDAEAPYFERELRGHLMEPTSPEDRFIRQSWAAEFLLPAFNRAAHELAQRAAEVTSTGSRATSSAGTGDIT